MSSITPMPGGWWHTTGWTGRQHHRERTCNPYRTLTLDAGNRLRLRWRFPWLRRRRASEWILSMSAGSLSTVMDVSPNANHQTLSDGTSYGLWIDGSPHPYRDGLGDTYILVPHSENYRFRVDNWNSGAGWILSGPTLQGARNVLE